MGCGCAPRKIILENLTKHQWVTDILFSHTHLVDHEILSRICQTFVEVSGSLGGKFLLGWCLFVLWAGNLFRKIAQWKLQYVWKSKGSKLSCEIEIVFSGLQTEVEGCLLSLHIKMGFSWKWKGGICTRFSRNLCKQLFAFLFYQLPGVQ